MCAYMDGCVCAYVGIYVCMCVCVYVYVCDYVYIYMCVVTMCVDRLQQFVYINSNTARNMLGLISDRINADEGSSPGGTVSIARNTSHLNM